jgi:hypothetical protein
MGRTSARLLIIAATIGPLISCTTAIDLSQLQPLTNLVSCAEGQGRPRPAITSGPVDLNFGTLVSAVAQRAPGAAPMAAATPTPAPFQQYAQAVMAKKALLPPELQSDPVVDAIYRIMIKSSANAHVNAQIATAAASGTSIPQSQVDEVRNYPVPSRVSHSEIKQFAETIFTSGLRQTVPVSPINPAAQIATVQTANNTVTPAAQIAAQSTNNVFGTYFTAYYSGKFYDRLGKNLAKPTISLTVSDAEIAGALSFLLEYTVDLIDPTPVLGSDPTPVDAVAGTAAAAPAVGDAATKGTTYFPGNSTNKPTALAAYGNSIYLQIPATSTCGWNQQNAPALGYVASAAGDQAGGVSGLLSGSFGGVGVALGVFGKLSIGDNQTLATLVKSAASRLAERITLAATYWAFKAPTAAGAPTPSMHTQ